VAGINADRAPNGYALNMSFDPMTVAGDKGLDLLNTLLKGYFENRGMELQLNVLDHGRLEEAYNNPGKHPGIVVRVAGYCAYFDDLPKGLKEEILNRNYQLLKSA
ncbi:hypothetical protein KKA14_01005, partial [bacterium]|nr:hypothetical protein [bacterium]